MEMSRSDRGARARKTHHGRQASDGLRRSSRARYPPRTCPPPLLLDLLCGPCVLIQGPILLQASTLLEFRFWAILGDVLVQLTGVGIRIVQHDCVSDTDILRERKRLRSGRWWIG